MEETSLFSQTVLQFMGPVRDFLEDDGVSEVMINGPEEIYIETKGKLIKTDRKFNSLDSLMAAIRNVSQFVGRTIDEKNPIMDARLPDGSRVHAMIPPVARRGPYVSIRRFSRHMLSIDDLIKGGSLPQSLADFIHACVLARKNIVVAGGTGSGKTTLLNIISAFIPASEERIIVIEDSSELSAAAGACATHGVAKAGQAGQGRGGH